MSIKTLREALCQQQADSDQWPQPIASAVDVLINMIDRHRPLGPDGKHGDRARTDVRMRTIMTDTAAE